MRRLAPLLLAIASGSAGDAPAWTAIAGDPWRFAWDERLAMQDDPGLMPGMGRRFQPVAAGAWGEGAISGTWAGDPPQWPLVPGAAPWRDGAQARLDQHLVGEDWSLHLAPVLELGGRAHPPAMDPALAETTDGAQASAFLPLATALWMDGGWYAAVSTETFGWGDALGGGLLVNRRQALLPHAAVGTTEPLVLGTVGDDLLLMQAEAFAAVLTDDRSGPADPAWLGARSAWRAGAWSGAVAWTALAAGDAEWWHRGTVEFGLRIGQELEWRMALLHDDLAAGRSAERLAWVATLDALDLTGDQDWRLAFEWHHSGSAVGRHPGYGAAADGPWLLGHGDGGGSSSLRILLQHDAGTWSAGLLGCLRHRTLPGTEEASDTSATVWWRRTLRVGTLTAEAAYRSADHDDDTRRASAAASAGWSIRW